MTALATTADVDLSTCDREPIHTPGFIQSHGCLLACRSGEFELTHVSANAASLLGISLQTQLTNADIRHVLGDGNVALLDASLSAGAVGTGLAGRAFGLRISGSDRVWDGTVHDYGGMRFYELEPGAEAPVTPALELVRTILSQLQHCRTLRDLCDQSVHLIRDLIGFDRVMVYRFLEYGAGHFIAESKSA